MHQTRVGISKASPKRQTTRENNCRSPECGDDLSRKPVFNQFGGTFSSLPFTKSSTRAGVRCVGTMMSVCLTESDLADMAALGGRGAGTMCFVHRRQTPRPVRFELSIEKGYCLDGSRYLTHSSRMWKHSSSDMGSKRINFHSFSLPSSSNGSSNHSLPRISTTAMTTSPPVNPRLCRLCIKS